MEQMRSGGAASTKAAPREAAVPMRRGASATPPSHALPRCAEIYPCPQQLGQRGEAQGCQHGPL